MSSAAQALKEFEFEQFMKDVVKLRITTRKYRKLRWDNNRNIIRQIGHIQIRYLSLNDSLLGFAWVRMRKLGSFQTKEHTIINLMVSGCKNANKNFQIFKALTIRWDQNVLAEFKKAVVNCSQSELIISIKKIYILFSHRILA